MPAQGRTHRILRVNLTNRKVSVEELNKGVLDAFLGGRGVATRLLYEEVPAGTPPLDGRNKLIFMTGPLTGTGVPTAGRYDVVAKSPLTSLFGAASGGGHFGAELRFAGFDGVVVEGVAPKPVTLVIRDGDAELRDATHLWGLPTSDAERLVKEELNDFEAKVACIGPAGENLVRFAAIISERTHAAGRCGLGAVMGAKKLKAIAVSGSGDVEVHDPDALRQEVLELVKRRDVLSAALSAYGSAAFISYVAKSGAFPTHNFKALSSDSEDGFDLDDMSEEVISERLVIKKDACFCCRTGCRRASRIPSGEYEGELGSGPEYESVAAFARCGCSDADMLLKFQNVCNELGLDVVSAGSAVSFAMECYEHGILTREDTGGLELRWGDADVVIELLGRIARREGVGDVLAEGVRTAAATLNAEKYAMHVGGLEIPGYEPRALQGYALSLVTSNRGADAVSSMMMLVDAGLSTPLVQDVSAHAPADAKTSLLKELEDWMQVFDSLIICKFFGLSLRFEQLTRLIKLATGLELSWGELKTIGERIWNLQRLYNLREAAAAGTRASIGAAALPGRFFEEPLRSGAAAGKALRREEFEARLKEYYGLRGWDADGVPTAEKLRELGLGGEG
ncbi:MAG: aldehyde ferredoxin oxidoreductase family protein [Candidatus Alkanophagales archaeon]